MSQVYKGDGNHVDFFILLAQHEKRYRCLLCFRSLIAGSSLSVDHIASGILIDRSMEMSTDLYFTSLLTS